MKSLLITVDETKLEEFLSLFNDIKKLSHLALSNMDVREEFYSSNDLLKMLKISKKSLARYRSEKLIPYIHINGLIRYKKSDVDAFIDEHYISKKLKENYLKK